jgi:hypothetical protein
MMGNQYSRPLTPALAAPAARKKAQQHGIPPTRGVEDGIAGKEIMDGLGPDRLGADEISRKADDIPVASNDDDGVLFRQIAFERVAVCRLVVCPVQGEHLVAFNGHQIRNWHRQRMYGIDLTCPT